MKTKIKGVIYRHQRPEDIIELAKLLKEVSNESGRISARNLDTMHAMSQFFKIQADAEKGRRISIVAEYNGKIVGHAMIKKMSGRLHKVGEVGIIVKKEFRNLGIGTSLMKTLFKEAKKIGIKIALLQVIADNESAIHVYKKLKFKEMGRLPKCFDFGNRMKDVIYMYRTL